MPERTIWFQARIELLKHSSFQNNQKSKLPKILLVFGAIKRFSNCKMNKLGFNEHLGSVSSNKIYV